jgi:hypothetical protein
MGDVVESNVERREDGRRGECSEGGKDILRSRASLFTEGQSLRGVWYLCKDKVRGGWSGVVWRDLTCIS